MNTPKARILLDEIQQHEIEIQNRLKRIDALKLELEQALELNKSRVVNDATPSVISINAPAGDKSISAQRPPTLGDLVRDILSKAGKPLTHVEIREALKKRGYKNSKTDPFKTLQVRLHKLSGVKNIRRGLFTVENQDHFSQRP